MRRYLFGPISKNFAEQNLYRQRQAGQCLAFDSTGATDVLIEATDTWGQVCARLPSGWQPDFIVLYLPYTSIPACLWTAPVPLVGLALDWPLLWHYYRRRLRAVDCVLTDPLGVETLFREGIVQARSANLHGCERRFVEPALDERNDEPESQPSAVGGEPREFQAGVHGDDQAKTHHPSLPAHEQRDIDILFVGNLNPAVQPERLRWIHRLARLGHRWRVSIQTGVFGDAYRRLLCRTRMVFNSVAPHRLSRRLFETAAAGALLFEDAANVETSAYFRDRRECVFYNSDNLEALLTYYLEHESERRKLAEAAQARARHYTFEALWGPTERPEESGERKAASEGEESSPLAASIIDLTEQKWSELAERSQQRALPGKTDDLLVRCWQALNAPYRSDPFLIRDLEAALTLEPGSAQLHHCLGLALTRLTADSTSAKARAEVAAWHFRQALSSNPGHALARLNLAEALEVIEAKSEALEEASRALALLERLPEIDPGILDAGLFQTDFGLLRMQWERAAWSNAGRPLAEARAKRDLLRWRGHALLAKWTGKVAHYYEAYLSRPDLAACSSALGCTLASTGHPLEGLAHLRRGLKENPFDRDAARALHRVLTVASDHEAARQLVEDRRVLARVAPQVVAAEAWFSDPAPSVHDLASIIILCCNQVEFTRQCLESVLRCTRAPYELILVDNGSADGTREYLEEIRSLTSVPNPSGNGQKRKSEPGDGALPVRIEVIRNETNRGFPAGCNQALSRGRGRFLVFLNNDTVVTPGWLEPLVARSLDDWPSIGLVGAVSNNAPDAQGVAAGYRSLDGLGDFAGRRRRDFASRILPVKRLTGFCLLVRREVFDRVGKFDERYGVGFFDDDDLCLRAREAGFRLVIALDVYVHHFGSRTFKGLGLNSRDLLLKNFDLFRDKWGAENVLGYHLIPSKEEGEKRNAETETRPNSDMKNEPLVSTPGGDVSPADSEVNRGSKIEDGGLIRTEDQQESDNPKSNGGDQVRDRQSSILDLQPDFEPDVPVALVAEPRPKVSLCMIVKNEEAHLGPCLQSAADLFDEIVIADTGSTDRTKEIAANFGARVVDFPWVDSFSAARNEGLCHARGKWIMWLDADDRIDQINRQRLAELFRSLGDEKDAYSMKVRSVLDSANTSFRLLDQVRLFPSHPKVRWDYRVHEQTLPAVLRVGGRVRWTDVIIDHVGYQRLTARQSKLERNLRLLELDNTDRPDDPFTLFNLGWTLLDLGKTEEALPRLKRSLAKSSPDSSIARKLYHLITLTHRQLGQKDQALVICREGLQKFPDDTELLVEEGLMRLENREFIPAETNLLQLVETKPGPYFGSVDDGMRGYRTRDVLARHYRDQGRISEAEVQWRTAVAERSSFIPGWLGLGELFLRQGRRSDLERLTKSLDREPGGDVEAAILRARAHREREEFPAARRILEDLIPRVPQAEGPRVLLSHVLLQEGKDLTAAEDVLRQILELNPRNAEARHNLRVLLGKQGRTLEGEEEPSHRLATAGLPG